MNEIRVEEYRMILKHTARIGAAESYEIDRPLVLSCCFLPDSPRPKQEIINEMLEKFRARLLEELDGK